MERQLIILELDLGAQDLDTLTGNLEEAGFEVLAEGDDTGADGGYVFILAKGGDREDVLLMARQAVGVFKEDGAVVTLIRGYNLNRP